jgi:hypothetical protein
VEELQMDWLRSEDLKEEKNVTASISMIAGDGPLRFGVAERLRGVPWGMRRRHRQSPTSDAPNRSLAAGVLVREEPDEEEDEDVDDENDGKEEDEDEDEDNGDGYSE